MSILFRIFQWYEYRYGLLPKIIDSYLAEGKIEEASQLKAQLEYHKKNPARSPAEAAAGAIKVLHEIQREKISDPTRGALGYEDAAEIASVLEYSTLNMMSENMKRDLQLQLRVHTEQRFSNVVFAFNQISKNLRVFQNEHAAINYCSTPDIECGTWIFWNESGAPLEIDFLKRAKKGIFVTIKGKYRLIPCRQPRSSLSKMLQEVKTIQGPPPLNNLTQIRMHLDYRENI
ncbi:hypothetical protein UNDKW_0436 [Undibacterium sp. KW1]|uniref:hypothetical protein n=1 Tax=Undibacterium sp. KW1 TaxID=2058624 RepID=UPI001331F876|nr:hypothetical protein [Undibacterium sp. KW1]BBB58709.1 hypothetical protein UNDKW_0436 [Undibacterium sp. KW1]